MNYNCKSNVNPRDIFGEYDPPIPIVKNPTKEQRETAERLIEKYERLAAEKQRKLAKEE